MFKNSEPGVYSLITKSKQGKTGRDYLNLSNKRPLFSFGTCFGTVYTNEYTPGVAYLA
jgi:hypothetical protein